MSSRELAVHGGFRHPRDAMPSQQCPSRRGILRGARVALKSAEQRRLEREALWHLAPPPKAKPFVPEGDVVKPVDVSNERERRQNTAGLPAPDRDP